MSLLDYIKAPRFAFSVNLILDIYSQLITKQQQSSQVPQNINLQSN